tara:strand:- start:58 stop:204 length:147 start_codon:yes stop_codon:yes gene_type:complete
VVFHWTALLERPIGGISLDDGEGDEVVIFIGSVFEVCFPNREPFCQGL